ncbi:unnamed protein product [Kluyveromyces dobzhanskii CBS 2104]|uniref:WGS project CCBQ000000000 data, contig 00099 n=1 Tax=Kluyveromyces dobzhanskii CBS 2104 TaxID=1427455 RepID=A0A0A8L4S1_9SACH|nr:unnamed protein product [Kluyveromyces dobzhanskii CBS 2104]
MNVFDEVLQPSVVNKCLHGNFTSSEKEEYIVARTDILSIFRVSKAQKLLLAYEWKLSGKIVDMQLLPQIGSPLKVLVILSPKSKLSLVRFDQVTESLGTLSLHYYHDKFVDYSTSSLKSESIMAVDPSFRCVLVFNEDVLAILPLNLNKEDLDIDEDESVATEPKVKRLKTGQETTSDSIILPVSTLHKTLKHVYDIKWLDNFNKPTLGILYQPVLAWCGNEKALGNTMRYMVLSLDLEDERTTVIAQLSDLPNDLHTVVPLRRGYVLIGVNELLYISSSGSLQSCIKLNTFASPSINTRITDNSSMNVFLPKSSVYFYKAVKKQDILILMDENCRMYNVITESEGNLLTKFDCAQIPIVNEIFKHSRLPLSVCGDVNLNTGRILIGFHSGDAMFLQLKNLKVAFTSKRKVVETVDDEDDEYNALYGDSQSSKHTRIVEKQEPFDISLLDSLSNVGPITSLTIGKVASVKKSIQRLPNPNKDEYSVVVTSGVGSGSHLTALHHTVQPDVEQALKFTSATRIWNLKIKGKDKYLVTTDADTEKSDVYQIDRNFEPFRAQDFRKDSRTVDMETMDEDRRILQVTSGGLYLFDSDFKRLARLTIDVEIVHACIIDPYILFTDARGNIKIYQLDSKNKKKFIKFKLPEALNEIIITSGSIFRSNICNRFLHGLEDSFQEQLLFTFVTGDNQVIFFTEKHNDRIFQINGVDQLEDVLFVSLYQIPDEMNPNPSIKQILLNRLGHYKKEEYLTILTFGGEIYQYKKSTKHNGKLFKCKSDPLITGAPNNAYPQGVNKIERVAHYFPNYNGYSVVFITGQVPYIIIKEDNSVCRIFRMTNIPIVTMVRWGKNSVMCVDNIKNARVMKLDLECYYGNSQVLRKITVEDVLEEFETLGNIAYHERTGMYVVSYTKFIEYQALSEDGDPLVGYDSSKPNSTGYKSGVLLINPHTWNIIDRVDLPDNSMINDIKTMLVQLSSKTRRKREFVIVGSSFVKEEDQPSTGSLVVLDITEVVAEPGKPGSNYKFKEIFEEEIRGSVNTVCEISGRFMIGQSSKALIRDMQEDNSAVPVAFLDMPVFITDAKSFSNLMIIGDSMQGFTFVGFDAEPYRMIVLGKSTSKFQVMNVEFLVNNGNVNFVISDRENHIHVLRYAPDEPNSLSGQRLVHCNTFNIFSTNNCLKLVKKHDEFSSNTSSYISLGGQADGSLFRMIPLSEASYRRFYLVQQQLLDHEVPLAGLNPKMERLGNEYYHKGHALRPTLDSQILKKYIHLPINKRTNIENRVGRHASTELWHDLIDIEFSLRSLTNSN